MKEGFVNTCYTVFHETSIANIYGVSLSCQWHIAIKLAQIFQQVSVIIYSHHIAQTLLVNT